MNLFQGGKSDGYDANDRHSAVIDEYVHGTAPAEYRCRDARYESRVREVTGRCDRRSHAQCDGALR